MSPPSLSLAVVGADFPNKKGPGRRFEIALCKPGEPVELMPEPRNPVDPRAIAVLSKRGVQLGYLTAERCGRIGSLIERGHEVRAVFQRATTYGCVIRAAFDGEVPVLPPEPDPIECPDDDVPWVDEAYPDE